MTECEAGCAGGWRLCSQPSDPAFSDGRCQLHTRDRGCTGPYPEPCREAWPGSVAGDEAGVVRCVFRREARGEVVRMTEPAHEYQEAR